VEGRGFDLDGEKPVQPGRADSDPTEFVAGLADQEPSEVFLPASLSNAQADHVHPDEDADVAHNEGCTVDPSPTFTRDLPRHHELRYGFEGDSEETFRDGVHDGNRTEPANGHDPCGSNPRDRQSLVVVWSPVISLPCKEHPDQDSGEDPVKGIHHHRLISGTAGCDSIRTQRQHEVQSEESLKHHIHAEAHALHALKGTYELCAAENATDDELRAKDDVADRQGDLLGVAADIHGRPRFWKV